MVSYVSIAGHELATLTELIQGGLREGQYPLFVAEGTPEKSFQQIQGSGYLWYCLDKLRKYSKPFSHLWP